MKKQEAKKLNKKWLIPGICLAALLVIAGAVMVLFGGMFQSQEPVDLSQSTTTDGKLYWNVERDSYKDGMKTHQNVGEDLYRMLFSVDGEQISLTVRDRFLVRKIDTLEVMGLVFDQEGIVVGALNVEECTGGYAAKNFFVESVDGDTVVANNNNAFRGYTKTIQITENTKIYNVGDTGPLCGLPSQVSYNDEIIAIEDTEGNISHVYVIPYKPIGDVYWNVDMPYDSTLKMSTRQPTEMGHYELTFILNGKEVTYRCRDKAIVDQIDASRVLGLEFDEDGYISGKIDVKKATHGGRLGATNYYVSEVTSSMGSMRFRNKPIAGEGVTVASLYPNEGYIAYDMTGTGDYKGQVTDVRVNDRVICVLDSRTKISIVYVVRRAADTKLYWNVDRAWDSTNLTTKRTPDYNGWYYFKMAVDGQHVTVRTNDKAIANAIEQPVNVGLKLNGDIVERVYPASVVYPAGTFASWYIITAIGEDGALTVERTENGKTTVKTGKLAENCDIFNTSLTANLEGERISASQLKVGDTIHAYMDFNGDIAILYLVTSVSDSPMYWNVDRSTYWDSKNRTSKRVPDENGYYNILFAVNGKQVTLKTADKKIVDDIDSRTCMGLNTSGSIITKVFGATQTTATQGGMPVSLYHVTAINGNTITATMMSGADKGKTVTKTMAWNVQIYDVSKTAELVGQKSSVQVGDQIRAFANKDKQISVLYILAKGNHGENHVCDCCGKDVLWLPYDGTGTMADGNHYVLAADLTVTKAIDIKKDTTVTLCLNGHTMTSETRRVLGDIKGTLNIVDCVGTGGIHGQMDNNASVSMISGGTLNIYGGKMTAEEVTVSNKNGGIFAIIKGGQINMYGGEIAGGKCTGYGGNINVSDGTFTLHDGKITGGTSGKRAYGGNIALSGQNAKLIINGGEVSGGKSGSYGGNIAVSNDDAVLEIHGGLIQEGTATTHGGNICVAAGKLTVTGGTIDGEKATATSGCNISLVNSSKATFLGGKIFGSSIRNSTTTPVTLGGSVNISGLSVGSTLLSIDAESLTKDAKIMLDISGYKVIAENVKKDVSKLFGSSDRKYQVEYVDGKLVVDMATKHTHCDCGGVGDHTCDDTIIWKPFAAGTKLADGEHYYLTGDLDTRIEMEEGATAYLCLNGYTVNSVGDNRVFADIQDHQSLSIYDCGDTGTLHGHTAINNASVAMVKGELNIYGGTFKADKITAAKKNGGILMAMGDGVINFYNGTITGGDTTGNGGCVYIAQNGSLNIYGGEISGGTAAGLGQCLHFGATGTLTLGGDPQIEDLYLASGCFAQIHESFDADNASIGLTMAAPGVFAQNAGMDTQKAFLHTNTGYGMVYDTAEKTLSLYKPHSHCWCENAETVPAGHTCVMDQEWTAIYASDASPYEMQDGGHYYLNWTGEATGVAKALRVADNATAYLCLNGCSVRARNTIALGENSQLIICDCSENETGLITTTGKTPVTIADGQSVTLMSGTVSGTLHWTDGSLRYPNTSIAVTGGSFTMYGGAVTEGNNTSGNGGNINATGGVVAIYGGEISGGTASGNGQDVYIGGTADILIGGKAKIGQLYLDTGKAIAIDGLDATEALVYVIKANPDEIVATNADADYSANFPSGSSAYQTKLDGTNLVFESLGHMHCWCKGAENAPTHTCENEVVWTAIQKETGLSTTMVDGGHYYLDWTGESAQSLTVADNATAYLCLNGASIRARTVLTMGEKSSLIVCDCSANETGILTTSRYSPVTLNAEQSLTLVSGSVSGTYGTTASRISVVVNGGSFTMYGGHVVNGCSNTASSVQYKDDNPNGANISAESGTVAIYGGTVTGGTTSGNGKDIYIGANASVTLGGSPEIGEIYLSTGKQLTLDGLSADANIGINSADKNTAPLATGITDNAIGQAFHSTDAGFETICLNGELLLSKLQGDHTHCWCKNAAFVPTTHACQDAAVWTELTDTTEMVAGGHYFLNSKRTTMLTLPEGEVYLCLNGFELSAGTQKRAMEVGSGKTIHICDCGTTGTVKGETNASAPAATVNGGSLHIWSGSFTANAITNNNGGVMNVLNNGHVYMYGGSIHSGSTSGSGNNRRGGNINIGANGTFTMYAGNIYGGQADLYGGNIAITNASGRFEMKGGSIYGGIAGTHGGNIGGIGTFIMEAGSIYDGTAGTYGGNVSLAVSSSATITGGTITGGTATEYAPCVYMNCSGALTVGGSAQISDVYLATDKTVTVSAENPLTGTKVIGLTLESATGNAVTGAADANAFFSSDNALELVFDNGTVSLQTAASN